MSPRHRTASTEIEGRILDAALRILDERGVEALTVRGIATEAGIAPMGIYNRFDGKMGIYEALWVEGFDRLTAELSRITLTEDPRADLLRCGLNYRDFARHNPSHYRLMFMTTQRDFVPSVDAASAAARALQCLIDHIERAQLADLLPPGPSLDLAQSFWAAVHGFAALELSCLVFAVQPDVAYRMMLEAVLAGFSCRVDAP